MGQLQVGSNRAILVLLVDETVAGRWVSAHDRVSVLGEPESVECDDLGSVGGDQAAQRIDERPRRLLS